MNHKHIFIIGLHRSGTTALAEILSSHDLISGFKNTNVPKDEGQHLQTVYPTGKMQGGPGKFGFNNESYLNESSKL